MISYIIADWHNSQVNATCTLSMIDMPVRTLYVYDKHCSNIHITIISVYVYIQSRTTRAYACSAILVSSWHNGFIVTLRHLLGLEGLTHHGALQDKKIVCILFKNQ